MDLCLSDGQKFKRETEKGPPVHSESSSVQPLLLYMMLHERIVMIAVISNTLLSACSNFDEIDTA